ncbi:MAG: RNA-binding S4 domain-containing protein [Pseudomonadales bacterium]
MNDPELNKVRLDRWLWAARFFKTRAQAKSAIDGGKVQVDGSKPKVAKEIQRGASIRVRKASFEQTVVVTALAAKRGSAKDAALLYEETAASIELREALRAQRQMQRAGLRMPERKPSKQERRALTELKRDSDEAPDVAT